VSRKRRKSKGQAPPAEPEGAALPPNEELEEALREAANAVGTAGAESAAPAGDGSSAGLDDEPSEGALPPNEDLEQALRDAADAVEGRAAASRDFESAAPEVEKELAETRDRLIRLQADFENFRRRTLRERAESFRYGHQNVVKDLLPTVDNLERAIAHARDSGGGDLESFLQGVELVLRDLVGVLTKHGVTAIEAEGRPFDPSVHEAMGQVPDDSVAPNTVIQVLEKGYQLLDRMLRPTRVMVSGRSDAGAPKESDAGDDEAAERETE
jgi:molecular chaperone GrpE